MVMEYIEKVDEQYLYDDGIGKVELFDFSRANQNEESRVEAIATIASVCYNKPPKSAKKLVKRLMTESGGLPSSAFEFVRSGLVPSIESSLRNRKDLETDASLAESPYSGSDLQFIQSLHKNRIATFRVTIPIFVGRQIVRHRSYAVQELSRRYTTDESAPFRWWEIYSGFKKHNVMADIYEQEYIAYHKLIDLGAAPEQARAVLGTGLYTELWLQSDVPGLKNYFKLRLDKHTQKEHRELAQAMLDLLKKHQPELWKKVKPEVGVGMNEEAARNLSRKM